MAYNKTSEQSGVFCCSLSLLIIYIKFSNKARHFLKQNNDLLYLTKIAPQFSTLCGRGEGGIKPLVVRVFIVSPPCRGVDVWFLKFVKKRRNFFVIEAPAGRLFLFYGRGGGRLRAAQTDSGAPTPTRVQLIGPQSATATLHSHQSPRKAHLVALVTKRRHPRKFVTVL